MVRGRGWRRGSGRRGGSRGGLREDPEDVDLLRVLVGYEGREGRDHEKQGDDDSPGHGEAVPEKPAEEIPEDGARSRAHAPPPIPSGSRDPPERTRRRAGDSRSGAGTPRSPAPP